MLNKIFTGTIIAVFCTFACQSTQQSSITKEKEMRQLPGLNAVVLQENSRGVQNKYTYTADNLRIENNRSISSKKISSAVWKSIEEEFIKLETSKIPQYSSTGTLRYSDAALSSFIVFIQNNKEYRSAEFDAGDPPRELKSIYFKLLEANKTSK